MLDGRIRAWLALAGIRSLDTQTLHKLLTAFGSAEDVVAATPASLARHAAGDFADAVRESAERAAIDADAVAAWSGEPGNHLLTWDDPRYPKSLLQVSDAPPLLYYKGRLDLLDRPAVAVVGSRNASPAGIRIAEEFAETLALSGVTIVSGLALGIDAAAHRGALRAGADGGSTIAVVGTGIDRIYPRANGGLARQIAAGGGMLSEFPLSTPPLKPNFPYRNRLISGLAQGVLVVEAAVDSGSLITARCAGEQGRDVFAIPGSIHSPFSKGCHKLIKQGAKLVETAQDVLDELQIRVASRISRPTGATAHRGPDERAVLDALGFDSLSADELVARLTWPVERVMTHLLTLEIAGAIAQLPGGSFQRLR